MLRGGKHIPLEEIISTTRIGLHSGDVVEGVKTAEDLDKLGDTVFAFFQRVVEGRADVGGFKMGKRIRDRFAAAEELVVESVRIVPTSHEISPLINRGIHEEPSPVSFRIDIARDESRSPTTMYFTAFTTPFFPHSGKGYVRMAGLAIHVPQ